MKRLTKIAATAALLGVVAFAGPPAVAHFQGYGPGYGYGPGSGMMHGPGMMHGGPGMMRGGTYDQAAFDALKTRLGITAEQEAAWNAYVEAATANAQSMIDTHNSMDFEALRAMTPEERAQFMQGMHEARQDQMTEVLTAREALFATLTPQQRRLAANTLGAGYGMGPGMMMGGGGYGCPWNTPGGITN